MNKWIYFLIALIFAGCTANLPDEELLGYVNPFVGTGGHGHTFPGATAPFGMVQLSPDTRLEGWDGCSGYHYTDSVVYGFSHTHLSGTGVSDYGDVLLMPNTGNVQFDNGYKTGVDSGYASRFAKSTEKASPGYYAVSLQDYNIDVELTASPRAGMHRYTLPGGEFHVMLDLEHRDMLLDYQLTQTGPEEVSGFRFSKAWAVDQRIFFVAEFSKPISKVAFNEKKTKAAIHFEPTTELIVRVGISAVSVENARENLHAEIDHWDFDRTRSETEKLWRAQLGAIEVEGGTSEERAVFYTALYHTMLAPNLFSDVNGEYRGMDGQFHRANHNVYTVFSLWDTFRALHPLFTIIERERTTDFIKTFLLHYEQGGRLPVWELAGNETDCMIGYHSVPVIVDAYAKGIQDFDAQALLNAMDDVATMDHFGLQSYQSNGCILAGDEPESVSKTLEYAYDDWCIAEFAKMLGDTAKYNIYINRAQYYKNLFDPSTKFFRARMDGAWFSPFDPAEVNYNYTEANAWQYSMFAPQDASGLIDLHGGDDAFSAHLDQMFTASSATTGRQQADITGLIGQYAHGNEPSHHMAYLYNYAGQPWKTQQRVRQIMDEMYQNQPDGLSGNEDCGQMSAWYVFSAMGFYPVTPGSTTYAIGSPVFDRVTIHLENGNDFVISAAGNSSENVYVKSATLNGQAFNLSDLEHSDILAGGTLHFEMASEPNNSRAVSAEHRSQSKITAPPVAAVPFFESPSVTFTDSIRITVASLDSNAVIHYRIGDGAAQTYTNPLVFAETTKLRAWSKLPSGAVSPSIANTWYKIDGQRSIEVRTPYASQYSAGGDGALIDMLRGTENYRTGRWQGYQEQDLEVVVDLGSVQHPDSISIGFLQDIKSWIWFPSEVQFSVAKDSTSFSPVGTVANNFPDDQEGGFVQRFSVAVKQPVRFVKIKATNYGPCPEWHLGAGGESWLFADEIVVE